MAGISADNDLVIKGSRGPLKVGVAIPTYNEKENLQPLVKKLINVFKKTGVNYHIVVVDDNSKDGTGQLADSLSKKYRSISVMHRPGKLGLGSAYKDGFQFLLSDQEIDVVMEMDADLSHEPEYIPSMLEKILEGYDVVVGSRYTAGGGIGKEWAPIRQLISKSANFMTTLLIGLKVKDTTSGFRAYDAYALRTINLSKIRSNDYAFQIDMLFHCRNAGCEIAEVPFIFLERKHGKSKLAWRAIMEFIKTLEHSFARRFYWTFENVVQSSSIWITNTLWIGLKPLRIAIRETNPTVDESKLTCRGFSSTKYKKNSW